VLKLLEKIYLLVILLTMALSGFSQSVLKASPQSDGSILLSNGIAGILIPSEKNIRQNGKVLAPIQAFMLKDGSMSDQSPNILESRTTVSAVKIQPASTTEQLSYQFYYSFTGSTYYSCKITLSKNSKTIEILEDSNDDVGYSVQINGKHAFDQARYRGWNASSPEFGREPDGKQYRDENNRSPVDATLDFRFDQPTRYALMSNWDPAGAEVNTGRYWQIYKKTGRPEDPMFGIFQGKPSLLIGNKFVGVRFVSNPSQGNTAGKLELKMELERRGPDNSYVPRKRFQWCVYLTTRQELAAPEQYQPIGLEMNRRSGVASRVPDYCAKPMLLNPKMLKGSIYLEETVVQQLIGKVKKDKLFYENMIRIDPAFKQSLDAWRFPDSATSLKKYILHLYSGIRKELVQGDGTHAFNLKYWMGSMYYKNIALLIMTLFADESISLTAAEKNDMEGFLRLMARLLWDNDYVPFFDSSGINFGTANMSYQYRNNGRNFFALLFSQDPEFKRRAEKVFEETRKDLSSAIASNGISFASPHYTQATIDPILFTMLQLRNAGMGDLFKEQKELLEKFISFYTSLLTPPSVRFMGYRKLVSIGDGSEESAATFALLGAGLRGVDSSLSNNMYFIFENGAARPSAFGSMGITVDLQPHNGKTTFGSSNFPGYLSHARAGVNTLRESAAWIIHGETYIDHRNDDRGEAIIYALGAPLSLSRSSFYSPHVPDARMRSLVIPERLFPNWKPGSQNNTVSNTGNPWSSATSGTFSKFPQLVQSTSLIRNNNQTWTRRFIMVHVKDAEPIFIFHDSLSNPEPSVWSMAFMAESIFAAGKEPIKIPSKVYSNSNPFEIPNGSAEKALNSGWNRFYFMGQPWNKHPEKGINWWMHLYTPVSSSYAFTQWTNTWQNTQETEEFKRSNNRNYEETQQIIRWKSQQPFFAVITPFGKADSSNSLKSVPGTEQKLELRSGSRIYQITPWQLDVKDEKSRMIFFFGNQQGLIDGFGSSGGAVAFQLEGDKVTIMVSGDKGTRQIQLPYEVVPEGSDSPRPQTTNGKSRLSISYEGNETVYPDDAGYRAYTYRRK
jgi:hypothetical protein